MRTVFKSLICGFCSLCCLTPVLASSSVEAMPRLTCEQFLMNPLVVDQIKLEALKMPASAVYHVDEEKGACILTVVDEEGGMSYTFNSSSKDFSYDPNKQKFTIYLYAEDQPTCKNTVEASYDTDAREIDDAAYDFPYVENRCQNGDVIPSVSK